MAVKKSTVKNFYRALVASAYVAGATAAGAAFGGPAGAAAAASAATASLASPLGVASVEIAAETGAEYAVGAEKMAMGGLVTEPTFAMIGEAGPEMVIPLTGPGAFVSPLVKPKESVLDLRELQTRNSRRRSRWQTKSCERRTANSRKVRLKRMSHALHIDCAKRCERG